MAEISTIGALQSVEITDELLSQGEIATQKSPMPRYVHLVANWGLTYERDVFNIGVPFGNFIVKKGQEQQTTNVKTIAFGNPLMYPYPLTYKNDASAYVVYVLPQIDAEFNDAGLVSSLNNCYMCYTFEILMDGTPSSPNKYGYVTYTGYTGQGAMTMVYNKNFVNTAEYIVGNQFRWPVMNVGKNTFVGNLFLKATLVPTATAALSETTQMTFGTTTRTTGEVWTLAIDIYKEGDSSPLLRIHQSQYGSIDDPLSNVNFQKTKKEGGVAGTDQTPTNMLPDSEGMVTNVQLIMPAEIDAAPTVDVAGEMGASRAAFFDAFTFPASAAEKYALPQMKSALDLYMDTLTNRSVFSQS